MRIAFIPFPPALKRRYLIFVTIYVNIIAHSDRIVIRRNILSSTCYYSNNNNNLLIIDNIISFLKTVRRIQLTPEVTLIPARLTFFLTVEQTHWRSSHLNIT